MTFYIKLKIGEFYQPNSEVIAWVAYEGEGFKQYTYRDDFTFIYNNNNNDAFDTFKLTPYNTGKDNTVDHSMGYTWYDELIISTQPIALPTDSIPPSPPTNLQIN